jgi:hypothetical protein
MEKEYHNLKRKTEELEADNKKLKEENWDLFIENANSISLDHFEALEKENARLATENDRFRRYILLDAIRRSMNGEIVHLPFVSNNPFLSGVAQSTGIDWNWITQVVNQPSTSNSNTTITTEPIDDETLYDS